MAKVSWTIKADSLFDKYVFNAFLEYGQKTSKKWMQERIVFADRVAKQPESYMLEPLLADRKRKYRSCQIMGRFKIVYFYAKSSEVVHVVDIWDSKANPKALIRRIK